MGEVAATGEPGPMIARTDRVDSLRPVKDFMFVTLVEVNLFRNCLGGNYANCNCDDYYCCFEKMWRKKRE